MKRKISISYKKYENSKLATFISYLQGNVFIGWLCFFMPLMIVTFILAIVTQESGVCSIFALVSFFASMLFEFIICRINTNKIEERKMKKICKNKDKSEDEEEPLILLHKRYDGKYVCVPANKAKEYSEFEERQKNNNLTRTEEKEIKEFQKEMLKGMNGKNKR